MIDIVKISNEKALVFLKSVKANTEQVAISRADYWIAAIQRVNNEIIGVVGISFGKQTDRIKGFYVMPNYRKKGYGSMLLTKAILLIKANRITAFCTQKSKNLFLHKGFKIVKPDNKYGICFCEVII